ncbi:MAG: 1-(5-phosphoribosyl)-5-[(5-phosphoribosylamino)methylideneamino]imidazole-4-carboxamide isomerase [Clostridiales bacterium]|nr:1-(5-phosphoribosyl)-5-[(5-phosphoribosylamino)methylideneamino]imidazole-4-carboxamide isomerase [Clostridiales bacterium]
MQIIPAIDLRDGKCVRLVEGRLEAETVYSDDPPAQAMLFKNAGVELIHVVDLDGAFCGQPRNLEVVREIVAVSGLKVELGGGIRDMETIEKILAAGIERVVLGTAAIRQPALVAQACREYGERIVLGLDSRDGMVAIEGWESTVAKSPLALAREMRELGLRRLIYTDVRRDGTLKGPNFEAIEEMHRSSGMQVIASGGVKSLACIEALKKIGVEGAIIGMAIYSGEINLADALEIVR